MCSKPSKKLTDKNKEQTKAINKAIKKAVKKRFKETMESPISVKILTASEIDAIANNIAMQLIPDTPLLADTSSVAKKVRILNTKPSTMSFALTPYKELPCKQCPAKLGGLCACAIKANKRKVS